MKVKMKTLAAGPEGLYQPGQEVDLPAAQAKALIKGGYAEEVILSDVERQQKEPAESETAAVEPILSDVERQQKEPAESETAAVEPPEKAVAPKKTRKRSSAK